MTPYEIEHRFLTPLYADTRHPLKRKSIMLEELVGTLVQAKVLEKEQVRDILDEIKENCRKMCPTCRVKMLIIGEMLAKEHFPERAEAFRHWATGIQGATRPYQVLLSEIEA